jgi:predicted dehydrogenase
MTPAPALRVAIVGCGSIGREYALHHFSQSTNTLVASVIDRQASLASSLASDVGAAQAGAAVIGSNRYRSSVSEALGAPVPHATELTKTILDGCDIVYIGTTPSSHFDLVRAALDAGKHVLLEKPLASSAADADAIVSAAEAAEARGLLLAMNIGMRYNRAVHVMADSLRQEGSAAPRRRAATRKGQRQDPQGEGEGEGEGGPLEAGLSRASLSLHFARWPREWQQVAWCAGRMDGGALRECGTHYLFALHELLGPRCVRRVRATVEYPDGPSGTLAESSVQGSLELEGGLLVDLSVRTDGGGLAADGEDHYELELTCATSGTTYQLHDFVCLRRTNGPTEGASSRRRWKQMVTGGAYGRTDCVTALCDAIRRLDPKGPEGPGGEGPEGPGGEGPGGEGPEGSLEGRSSRAEGDGPSASGSCSAHSNDPAQRPLAPRMVTAREGRNVQRVLDAILSSNGRWVEVDYL